MQQCTLLVGNLWRSDDMAPVFPTARAGLALA